MIFHPPLYYKGKFIEAIDTFCKAINLKPDNGEFWNNLVFPLQALKINASSAKEISSYYPKNIDLIWDKSSTSGRERLEGMPHVDSDVTEYNAKNVNAHKGTLEAFL